METFDLTKNQLLMSIRKDGQISYIESKDGKLTTDGFVGDNTYGNFVELIKWLQGYDIHIDDFYY